MAVIQWSLAAIFLNLLGLGLALLWFRTAMEMGR